MKDLNNRQDKIKVVAREASAVRTRLINTILTLVIVVSLVKLIIMIGSASGV